MIESAKHNRLVKAINERKLITFQYHGKNRLAEPHDYGILRGARRLLSYQLGGESMTGGLPDWRLVEVGEIANLEITDRNFAGTRQAPTGQHYKWDLLFARVGENAT
jgi:hypothetical protein